MPIPELNSFLKSKKCSEKIKADVKTLRRRLKNCEYAKKSRDKKDEEIEWYQKRITQLNEDILCNIKEKRVCIRETLPYIKKFDQLCQEINDCQEFIVNYKIMSPEEFCQETEKLQYHKGECQKLQHP